MRMVQRMVQNKLGIQANSLKAEKNHEGKSMGGDSMAKRMKKSRSIKRPEREGSTRTLLGTHEVPQQPGKPPPLVSPTKTPSPQKPLSCKVPYGSPNYMKSTSSSEARKEQTKVSTSSPSMHHRVAKKVRTLIKVPSFKHTRPGGNKCSKVVLCEDFEVQRATCSSTLKDSRFPPYLVLSPGATEAEGTSAMKVCPYSYCSLNGHHHKPIPPLKCFLASRRRVLMTQRVGKHEIISPRKGKTWKKDVEGVDPEEEVIFSGMLAMAEADQRDNFFVEIYEGNNEPSCSEVDQREDTVSLGGPSTPVQDQDQNCSHTLEVDNSTSVSLDEFFGEKSDMEWEEGQFSTAYLEIEGSSQGANSYDQEDPSFESNQNFSGYFEEILAHKLLPYYHEEIAEWQDFSDAGCMAESETAPQEEEQIEQLSKMKEGDYSNTSVEEDANQEVKATFSNADSETREGESEDLDPYQEPAETRDEEANEESYTGREVGEENDAGVGMDIPESTESTLSEIDDAEVLSAVEQTPEDGDNSRDEFEHKEAATDANAGAESREPEDGNSSQAIDATDDGINEEHEEIEANKLVISGPKVSEEQDHSSTVDLLSIETCAVVVDSPEMEDINKAAELDASPVMGNTLGQVKSGSYSRKRTDPIQDLPDSCHKIRKSMIRKQPNEEEDEWEFNPRGPNFLPIEPDAESEKVDLRHQEMDERRNAEEWMLDHALQRTVNQLAPARKKKVALLVEAFESVMPIPKWEPHMRRNSSVFSHARLQACS